MHKIFVSGFPLEISELDLAHLIAPFGDISTVKIVRDRKTRVCKGYAFIEMQTAQGAANAIEALHGNLMDDRQLTLNLVEEKPATATLQQPVFTRNSPSLNQHQRADVAAESRKKRPRKVA